MAWDRDLGDEPAPAIRDRAPDVLAPIDEGAAVSGHRPPPERPASPAEAPEQDWLAAEAVLMPVLRAAGGGTRLADLDPVALASEGMKTHANPVVDDGPSGLAIGYVLRVGAFDVHVNADHLLAWGATPDELRGAAMQNLAKWSETAPWTDEASGQRRLISSASGDGGDATRILLPEVRADLVAALGAGAGTRVLIGVPERDLLVAGALVPGDEEFAVLFAEFIRDHAAGADQPIDPHLHEIVGGELRPFAG
ncbi:MAG TPA: hypothetical protein VFX65_00580 [Candidatus Limnocylindrales bacterium]|nr:hypothetical protein [Candidatus Limnocylindrales bacterium]